MVSVNLRAMIGIIPSLILESRPPCLDAGFSLCHESVRMLPCNRSKPQRRTVIKVCGSLIRVLVASQRSCGVPARYSLVLRLGRMLYQISHEVPWKSKIAIGIRASGRLNVMIYCSPASFDLGFDWKAFRQGKRACKYRSDQTNEGLKVNDGFKV